MTKSSISKICENIKSYRKRSKISQEQLSEMVGVTPDYISLIERGKRTPSIKILCYIAEVFNLEPYVLLK